MSKYRLVVSRWFDNLTAEEVEEYQLEEWFEKNGWFDKPRWVNVWDKDEDDYEFRVRGDKEWAKRIAKHYKIDMP